MRQNGKPEEELERRLDRLLALYREATPDPEPSADFMPKLWEQIEERKEVAARCRKWAQVFVAAAAALCLIFGVLAETAPVAPPATPYVYSVEAEEDNGEESMLYAGFAPASPRGER